MTRTKTIPLKELRWFSFTSDMDQRKQLTIWQSIFFILQFSDVAGDDLFEAMELFEKLEKHSAEDAIEAYLENSDVGAVEGKRVEVSYLEDVCLPEPVIEQEMQLLNSNRKDLVEYLGLPYTALLELLTIEIERYARGNRTNLKIRQLYLADDTQYLFSKGSLRRWNAISALKGLGLLDIDSSLRRRERSDKVDNQKLATGMLIHLLANQTSEKYLKGEANKNINFSKIYQEFKKAFLNNMDDSFRRNKP